MAVDWSKVVEQSLGVLIGGAITLSGLWIKEIFDRRREAQAWYEQSYITEGIDRMIVYASAVRDTVDAMIIERKVIPSIAGEYPRQAAERCALLFPNGPFMSVWLKPTTFTPDVHPDFIKNMKRMLDLIDGIKNDYVDLQHELLKVRITKKSQIHKIKEKRALKAILQRADNRTAPENWILQDLK